MRKFRSNFMLPLLALAMAPSTGATPDLQQDPISIDVADAPLKDVVAGFEGMTESRLLISPGLRERSPCGSIGFLG